MEGMYASGPSVDLLHQYESVSDEPWTSNSFDAIWHTRN